jgi:Kef-type K+ transport system membrane component KefB
MTTVGLTSGSRSFALAVGYVVMVVAGVGMFFLIRLVGEAWETAGAPAVTAPAPTASANTLPQVLLALVAIIASARVLGRLFALLGQPPVIGEVVAGICLGPSVFGALAPSASAFLLSPSIFPALNIIAQLGVILYLFLVGLELDTSVIRERGSAALAISHASIIAPFLLGAALALALYHRLAPAHVSFTVFALFLGVAMAITAFPVLARILTDRGVNRTPVGILALACAAAGDVTAWCLLALVVGVARADLGQAAFAAGGTLAYLAIMFLLVRPVLARWDAPGKNDTLSQGKVAAVLAAVLLSAWFTEWIGIHALFGAFLLGAVLPHDGAVARRMGTHLQDLVTILFLPVYFAFTGLRTQIGLLVSPTEWFICAGIIVVATVGKFGGTWLSARLTGVPGREASILGVLMNTRGLMELVVLNIGLDLGIITPTLFAMMVVMALVTTLATTPLLGLIPTLDRFRPKNDCVSPAAE